MLACRCHASQLLSTGYYLLATSCLLPFTSYFLLVANYYTTYWQHLFCILPPAFTYDLPRTQHIPIRQLSTRYSLVPTEYQLHTNCSRSPSPVYIKNPANHAVIICQIPTQYLQSANHVCTECSLRAHWVRVKWCVLRRVPSRRQFQCCDV